MITRPELDECTKWNNKLMKFITWKSLMTEWLEQASQWHEMYCHDLEAISLNLGRVELGVHNTSVLSRTWTKNIIYSHFYIIHDNMMQV